MITIEVDALQTLEGEEEEAELGICASTCTWTCSWTSIIE
ncbi:ALQxL family class IV lanthipeptide [Streptomyces sp. JJ36]|nr:ALQxL family class IV lanthipeptide [Streptomyces sp. JJ36]MCF6524642.1 ALQxL family class IV lanthipeptide [Streptomyces sp. JJ36]